MRKLATLAILIGAAALASTSMGHGRSKSDHRPHRGPAFLAFLDGEGEVPSVDTDGRGFALFRANPKKDRIFYILVTRHLEDILQAHIHMAPEGQNGPVVAFLFESIANPVTRNGLLSMGVIKAEDLIGPLNGEPLSRLVRAMNMGNAYVNVHTLAHPPGELRGQIHRANRRDHHD